MKLSLKIIAFCIFVIVNTVALFHFYVTARGKNAWEQFKSTKEAEGISFDRRSILPAAVPDEENFAAIPLLRPLYSQMSQPSKTTGISSLPEMQWLNELSRLSSAWKTNTPTEEIMTALQPFESELSQIADGVRLPRCRFPVRYEDGISALFPHLTPLRGLARSYTARSRAHFAAGKVDLATHDLVTAIRLARALDDEPILITELMQAAILQPTIQPLQSNLAGAKFTDAQLKSLQDELAGFNMIRRHQLAMHGERLLMANKIIQEIIEKGPRDRAKYLNILDGSSSLSKIGLITAVVPTGWWYESMLHINRWHLDMVQPALDPARQRVDVSRIASSDHYVSKLPRRPTNLLLILLAPAVGAATTQAVMTQTQVNLAQIALALERYRLKNQSYPASLDALVPDYIAKIPHEIVTGDPPRYRLESPDRYVLYSTGWNGTDEGGFVSSKREDGDWVWKAAADPADSK